MELISCDNSLWMAFRHSFVTMELIVLEDVIGLPVVPRLNVGFEHLRVRVDFVFAPLCVSSERYTEFQHSGFDGNVNVGHGDTAPMLAPLTLGTAMGTDPRLRIMRSMRNSKIYNLMVDLVGLTCLSQSR